MRAGGRGYWRGRTEAVLPSSAPFALAKKLSLPITTNQPKKSWRSNARSQSTAQTVVSPLGAIHKATLREKPA